MIAYRPFRNTDLRPLVDIWRSHAPFRGLVQPLSAALLEEYVLAKPYFDRQGLLIATHDNRPVGFAHAAPAGNVSGDNIDRSAGVVSMLMTAPIDERPEIEMALLDRAEAYLVERGAKTVHLGTAGRLAPFYLGLYGGGGSPGVLDSDAPFAALAHRAASQRDYSSIERRVVWTRELATLRTTVDRIQMQIRRRANVEVIHDPPAASWWEACAFGPLEKTRFALVGRDTGAVWAWVDFWAMDAFSGTWGVRSMGLARVEVDPAQRREGLATFLVGEALKQLHQSGVSLVETHTSAADPTSAALFRKLGFAAVDHGTILRKTFAAASD